MLRKFFQAPPIKTDDIQIEVKSKITDQDEEVCVLDDDEEVCVLDEGKDEEGDDVIKIDQAKESKKSEEKDGSDTDEAIIKDERIAKEEPKKQDEEKNEFYLLNKLFKFL